MSVAPRFFGSLFPPCCRSCDVCRGNVASASRVLPAVVWVGIVGSGGEHSGSPLVLDFISVAFLQSLVRVAAAAAATAAAFPPLSRAVLVVARELRWDISVAAVLLDGRSSDWSTTPPILARMPLWAVFGTTDDSGSNTALPRTAWFDWWGGWNGICCDSEVNGGVVVVVVVIVAAVVAVLTEGDIAEDGDRRVLGLRLGQGGLGGSTYSTADSVVIVVFGLAVGTFRLDRGRDAAAAAGVRLVREGVVSTE